MKKIILRFYRFISSNFKIYLRKRIYKTIMDYIYSMIDYIKGNNDTQTKFGKQEGYKNVNSNSIEKCGNRS